MLSDSKLFNPVKGVRSTISREVGSSKDGGVKVNKRGREEDELGIPSFGTAGPRVRSMNFGNMFREEKSLIRLLLTKRLFKSGSSTKGVISLISQSLRTKCPFSLDNASFSFDISALIIARSPWLDPNLYKNSCLICFSKYGQSK